MHCDQGVVEDGKHLILHCPKYAQIRQLFHNKVLSDGVLYNDDELICMLLTNDNPMCMFATARYLYDALRLRSNSAP